MLEAVTYADMAWRARPASRMPEQTVEVLLERAGLDLPGGTHDVHHRRQALGALSGMVTGLAVGEVVALARAGGLRMSSLTGSLVTGLAAMAATDGAATALEVADPSSWSWQDWVADAAPHLAYGVVTHGTISSMEEHDPDVPPATRASAGLVARSFALGMAAGARASLGLAVAARAAGKSPATTLARLTTAAAVAAELGADKHPALTSRLEPQGLSLRVGSAMIGATALAAHEDAVADLPVLAGVVGVGAGSLLGAWWRAADTLPGLLPAFAEDAVALGLAGWSLRR